MTLDLGTLVAHVGMDYADFASGQKAVEGAIRKIENKAPEVKLDANARPATNEINAVEKKADGLNGKKSTLKVDADIEQARNEIEDIEDTAEEVGDDAGDSMGRKIVDGLTDKLGVLSQKSGPIVGAVIGAVAAIAAIHPGVKIIEAITSDMANAREGLFSARTGLDPATAEKWGHAVGESYAQGFSTSVDAAMTTAQAALRAGLLAPSSGQSEITSIVNDLETLSVILEEDTPRLARAAAQAIKTGLAGDAAEAFDLLAKGGQSGLNVSEDLLDTVTEYGTQFRKLGLDGRAAFGLMSQAVQAGARDTDKAADALKEYSIRAVDGSEATKEAFEALGFDADAMARAVADGGEGAAEALDKTFKGLRDIEDPVKRNILAVALFGTQAEDLGAALDAMDLGKARTEFEDTAGTVDRAAEDIANNTGSKIEQARRSVETAAEGIKGALAEAFAPEAQGIAEWVQTNRGAITEFLVDLARRGFDTADAFLAVSDGIVGVAAFAVRSIKSLGDTAFDFIDGLYAAAEGIAGWAPGLGDRISENRESFQGKRAEFDSTFDQALEGADVVRGGIAGGRELIETLRERFDEVAEDAIARAHAADEEALANLQAGNVSVTNVYEFNGPIMANNPGALYEDARNQAGSVRVTNLLGMRRAV